MAKQQIGACGCCTALPPRCGCCLPGTTPKTLFVTIGPQPTPAHAPCGTPACSNCAGFGGTFAIDQTEENSCVYEGKFPLNHCVVRTSTACGTCGTLLTIQTLRITVILGGGVGGGCGIAVQICPDDPLPGCEPAFADCSFANMAPEPPDCRLISATAPIQLPNLGTRAYQCEFDGVTVTVAA